MSEIKYPRLVDVATKACPGCPKKHPSRVIMKHQGDQEIPHQVVFASSGNLDVMVAEDQVEGKNCYYVYKCEDPMCLLNFLREHMIAQWVENQKMKMKQEEAASRARKLLVDDGSRRANRRNKNKVTH